MQWNRRDFVAGSMLAGASPWITSAHAEALKPFGAVPTERQVQWQRMETCAFLHFTVNTFTGKEWGYGDEDPSIFAPTDFDADAIIRDLKAGGMRGVILTCKHHDGFCLWPTKTTEHCIRNSKWMGGKGDVVRAISDAARRQGMKFGVYVSPWDRNNAAYGTPAYLPIYRAQITELLTNYGPISEVWFDGANGGDGFYGGAKEKRTIDKLHFYGWPETWALVRKLQPGAVMFSDAGPDLRWVGNEKGEAGENCWATVNLEGEHGGPASPGDSNTTINNNGTPGGGAWIPAECDVSIRPGWFYHQAEDAKVKTPAELVALYDKSVGRGAGLLLNLPPDQRGRIAAPDAASLKAFHERIERSFQTNLLKTASLRASSMQSHAYRPANLINANPDSYWVAANATGESSVTATFRLPVKLNLVRLREAIRLGQRVRRWVLETQTSASAWDKVGEGESIGNCRIVRLPQPIAVSALRLRITEAAAPVALAEWGAYFDPA
ncbi:MAG: alpha-L-fucosidase [Janthinobacterium lividum]